MKEKKTHIFPLKESDLEVVPKIHGWIALLSVGLGLVHAVLQLSIESYGVPCDFCEELMGSDVLPDLVVERYRALEAISAGYGAMYLQNIGLFVGFGVVYSAAWIV